LLRRFWLLSTYPTEIVEATDDAESSNFKGEDWQREVDKQPWDPSVKALAQFPSVLEKHGQEPPSLSSLGDALRHSSRMYRSRPSDAEAGSAKPAT